MLEKNELEEAEIIVDEKEKLFLKENRVYIIIGGFGGLGLIFAEYLAVRFIQVFWALFI